MKKLTNKLSTITKMNLSMDKICHKYMEIISLRFYS